MPFKVLEDGATVDRLVTTRTSRQTGEKYDVVTSEVYYEGEYLSDEQVSPSLQEQVDNGEGVISTLLERVSDKEYNDNKDKQVADILAAYQAEDGGPLDEPRKIRESLTKLDLEDNERDNSAKGIVLESESSKEDKVESNDDGSDEDTTYAETDGFKRSADSGDVDEPRKNSQASTKLDAERNEEKAKVQKKSAAKKK